MTTDVKEKTKKQYRPYASRNVQSKTPFTKCICPKCGKKHKTRLHWTGKGTAKKYCQKCQKFIKTFNECDIEFHGENIWRK